MNIQNNPNFPQQLKDLSIAFLELLKELRSQASKEFLATMTGDQK